MTPNDNEAPADTIEDDVKAAEAPAAAPPVKTMGGFPWDKVFLELMQRGIDLKIDIDAKNKTLGLTALLTDEKGDTRHVSSSDFTFKTHMDEYEKFWQHAVSELAPDRL